MSGQIIIGSSIKKDTEVDCDVCVIGSGAGGSVLAAGLVDRGLNVIMLEEGGYHTREDFDLEESTAYPMMYQDRGMRSTTDLGVTIMQGRTVGGGTTVNWTTCFRTPDEVLERWADRFSVSGLTPEVLRPHFEAVEERLNIRPWQEALINENNRALLRGCRALNWDVQILRRNVKGCANTGYCGLGCPVDAKQAMHLTYIPDAIRGGMRLYSNVRADRILVKGSRVIGVEAQVMDPKRDLGSGISVRVHAKVVVNSGGAINGPGLLLRSGIESSGRVGWRTMLHPVVAVIGQYAHDIDPWYGAPQSVSSHEFINRGEDKVGFFMETPPIQPMLASMAFPLFGEKQAAEMAKLKNTSVFLGLARDGWVDGDDGGTVSLRSDGRIAVEYPNRDVLREGFKEAHKVLCRAHLAAGAKRVLTLHPRSVEIFKEGDLDQLEGQSYGMLEHPIFSAHQLGGCAMGDDPNRCVVDSELCHHTLRNLFVVDGSVFPTGLGVNPSESIYGMAHWIRDRVASAVQ